MIACAFGCRSEEKHNPISVRERNVWKDIGMRPPEPVVVKAPSSISDLDLPDSVFLIAINEPEFEVFYQSDSFACSDLDQLDSLIKQSDGQLLNARVALRIDSASNKVIDSVVAILHRNEIYRFNLITDLELAPSDNQSSSVHSK